VEVLEKGISDTKLDMLQITSKFRSENMTPPTKSIDSKEKGDIVIAVNGNEYPIKNIIVEEDLMGHMVNGNLKIGSYLSPEEMKSLNNDIVYPESFDIKFKDGKTYRNCRKGAIHTHLGDYPGEVFGFSGHL